jgi:hypothetical protein
MIVFVNSFFNSFPGRDCMEIGIFLMREHRYEVAKSWFVETLQKLLHENFAEHEEKILSHLFLATIMSGKLVKNA